ncbi:MAG: AMP-binding protein [Deltaproteobacteria bacterium]|nr:AMP-binding protein [Deltaproteobacteria bacterium]
MNLGQNLKVNAKKFPNTVCLKDSRRCLPIREPNRRVNRLSHRLVSLGLSKGDKLAVLLENSIEIIEALPGHRQDRHHHRSDQLPAHQPSEVAYIAGNSDAKALVVHDEFTGTVDPIRARLANIAAENIIVVGEPQEGYRPYEAFIMDAPESEPPADVRPEDNWILIYTSGTTGKPKGVVRTHESHIAFYLINAIDFGFNEHDVCMNVMPLCHINSTFFHLHLHLHRRLGLHPPGPVVPGRGDSRNRRTREDHLHLPHPDPLQPDPECDGG